MNRRLHIRLDEDRHARLAAEAARRGVPIAVIVREAIDAALPLAAATAPRQSELRPSPRVVSQASASSAAQVSQASA